MVSMGSSRIHLSVCTGVYTLSKSPLGDHLQVSFQCQSQFLHLNSVGYKILFPTTISVAQNVSGHRTTICVFSTPFERQVHS